MLIATLTSITAFHYDVIDRCNDMECSRDSRVSKLEREADTREGQLEEARADKARLQRQVDSISEQVDTCKLHIQKLTLSKESNEVGNVKTPRLQ